MLEAGWLSRLLYIYIWLVEIAVPSSPHDEHSSSGPRPVKLCSD